jgi:hypothetical protein
MPDYQQGKIYAIRSLSQPDLVYVGSTTQPLPKRFGVHKTPNNRSSSKQVINIGDAYIELIEMYPCDNVEQLRQREGEVMRSMDCVNKQSIRFDCPHTPGKKSDRCGQCNGSQVCMHGRDKRQCVPCCGSGICEHGRKKDTCKPCKGSSICQHGRIKSTCKPCGGSSICIHNRQKRQCVQCKGSSICIHNKQKAQCKVCTPMHCSICKKDFSGKASLSRHMGSNKHLEAMIEYRLHNQ